METPEAGDPFIWDDGERSKFTYLYPIPRWPFLAGHWWPPLSWKAVAERKALLQATPKADLYKRDGFWCDRSPASHKGQQLYAIDFLVPDGTPVLAGQFGRITKIVERHTEYGNDPSFSPSLNYVTLSHGGDEHSQYCHLAPGSVSAQGLRLGLEVRQGQRIGTVGKTGWTTGDHLHFLVFGPHPMGFKSRIPRLWR